ncbi:hypothetical protein EJ110_NYTH51238 [Nymphaea thermarum]|nr:hypothetical protein EJ110_NYTH51238 [Nymphaea thermarum]
MLPSETGSDSNFSHHLLTSTRYEKTLAHMHCPNPALTEAVQICHKNSDDFGLACTLAAICDLLSNIGVSSMNGILGSSYCSAIPASLDASLSTQRHLLALLKQSLERAESLKNARLIAFNRLALAKFDLEFSG